MKQRLYGHGTVSELSINAHTAATAAIGAIIASMI